MTTLEQAARQALEALKLLPPMAWTQDTAERNASAISALSQALEQPKQVPVLQDIEQYRIQMAGICTAAIGYWKEADGIHPDYDSVALRDVAKLYAKYDALYKAQQEPVREHDLVDVGCECCGYMTYHREHLGCIRAAAYINKPQASEPLTDELSILKAVSDEYNAWIRYHAGGGGYDEFLVNTVAAHRIGEKK